MAAQHRASAGVRDRRSGRRHTISVPELYVMARALKVPPLLLLFPIGRQESVEVLPGRTVPTWEAARWLTGETPLVSEEMEGELEGEWLIDVPDAESWHAGAMPARLARDHDRLLGRRSQALMAAGGAQYSADRSELKGSPERAAMHMRRVAYERQAVREAEASLRQLRDRMRELGLQPPRLPRDLVHLDDGPPPGFERYLPMKPLTDIDVGQVQAGGEDRGEGGGGLPSPPEEHRGGAGAPAMYGSGDFGTERKPGPQAWSISRSAGGRYVTRTSSPKSPKT